MKRFLKQFVALLGVFALAKGLFLWVYRGLYVQPFMSLWRQTWWHGLPLDLAVAAYLSLLPALVLFVGFCFPRLRTQGLWRPWFALVSLLLSAIFMTDLALYGFWGFRLDATALFYFLSSPKDALASVGTGFLLLGLAALLGCTVLLYLLFRALPGRRRSAKHVRPAYFLDNGMPNYTARHSGSSARFFTAQKPRTHKPLRALGWLLVLGLLFLLMRGGLGVSTLNTGRVYFSSEMALNHAAVNPAFSLLESLSKARHPDAQYAYLPEDQARALAQAMQQASPTDTLAYVDVQNSPLLRTARPNLLFVVLEGFFSAALPELTPRLDSLAREGIHFTRFYANSFRTDRGLTALFSGFPALPGTSVMKYPQKTQKLASIPALLKREGWDLQYYYGGDVNFTNMNSYLSALGFPQDRVLSSRNFPLQDRLSKWGAHDHVVFQRVWEDLRKPVQAPFLKIVQTSSSHEPFEVPFHKYAEPKRNALAYADSCLGAFVDSLRLSPLWDSTLVVLVADHAMQYPDSLDNLHPMRYHIPMVWTGGAVNEPRTVETYGAQQDLAATLLAALGLPYTAFPFSKDLMEPRSPHFAWFTFPNASGLVVPGGFYVYDHSAGKAVYEQGSIKPYGPDHVKAYMQTLSRYFAHL